MNSISNRRTFLKAGALLAAPVAVPAAAAAAVAGGDAEARLARREDEAAIRDLHHAWLRRTNGEGCAELEDAVQSIAPDHAAEPDAIKVTEDGGRAKGRFHCTVELRTELPRDCTLGQMAHAQGCGFVRSTEARVLEVDYVRRKDGWAIARLALA